MVIGELSIVAEFSNSGVKDTTYSNDSKNIRIISVTNHFDGTEVSRGYPSGAVFSSANINFWGVRTYEYTSFYLNDGTIAEGTVRDLNRMATTYPNTLPPLSSSRDVTIAFTDVVTSANSGLYKTLTTLAAGDEVSLGWYSSSSGNVVRFGNISMTITVMYTYDGKDLYDPSTLKITPNFVIVNGSNSVVATIQGNNTGICSHRIQWVAPGQSLSDENWETCAIGTTQSDAFVIPIEWQEYITGLSSTATCYVNTYWNDEYVGQSYTEFTVRVANASIPVIDSMTCVVDNSDAGTTVSDWGICVQGYSTVKLVVRATKSQNGTTVSSCIFKGIGLNVKVETPDTLEDTTENQGMIQFSYTVDKSLFANIVANTSSTGNSNVVSASFQAYIKDARKANSELSTASINAYKYASPSLTNVNVFRCDSNGNSTEDGTSCSLTFAATVSNLGTVTDAEGVTTIRNVFTSRWRLYSVQTGADGTVTRTYISGKYYTKNNSHTHTRTNYIESNWAGQIAVAQSYEVDLIVEDALSQRTLITRPIAADSYVLFFARGGNGVGIGCKTKKSTAALEINESWELFHGDDRIPTIKIFSYGTDLDDAVRSPYEGLLALVKTS